MIYARALGALGLVLVIGLGLWRLYHSGYQAGRAEVQAQWDADRIRRDAVQRGALLAWAARLKHAQEQHDHDQVTIDRLAADARRVHIHLPAGCDTAASADDPHRAAGLLSNRVDQSFARLQARAGGLFSRCDQLNIDAIRANAAAQRER